jgi:uncharacterized protein YprB with RNaseH-like and TPR domain
VLERTFLHINGVGEKKERSIWKAGVHDWAGFVEKGEELLPKGLYRIGLPVIRKSLELLSDPKSLPELAAMIPRREHWRFWPRYKKVAYLDIECGGDPYEYGGITMAAIYDGDEVIQYVAEEDLNELDHAMRGFEAVATFAGNSFDLPQLAQHFPGMYAPPIQIDLMWVQKRLGRSGGLKRIERQLGLSRPPEVSDLDGFGAISLWAAHQAGDPDALQTLKTYNAYDVINLKPLLQEGVKELKQLTLGRVF